MGKYVQRLSDVGMSDAGRVGGKNASLGEMLRNLTAVGVRVPDGFATTTEAFHAFVKTAGLEETLRRKLSGLDVEDVSALSRAGREIRAAILAAELPGDVILAVQEAYRSLSEGNPDRSFAVRSSATAEDMPEASFAGQQETFLNVRGEEGVLRAVKGVFASLFNDRAIAYRVHKGFRHQDVGISAAVQLMVRSDLAVSGVAFTLDTESGFRDVVFVTGSYGLGESVVQGAVNPDEFYLYKRNLEAGRPAVLSRTRGEKATKMVYDDSNAVGAGIQTVAVSEESRGKFVLSDAELEELGRQAIRIEKHYGRPMDIEWAKDGLDGRIYVVQARPETVKSRDTRVIERYRLRARGEVLVEGRAVGQKIATGPARLIDVDRMAELQPGEVLVTDMTDPDWEPVMKRAGAIVTNRGGRTCHAAIIARELGIPALVGCGDATHELQDRQLVTVSCAEGDTGYIYRGAVEFDVERIALDAMPELPLSVMMNVGNPERAFQFASLPHAGVGLARLEFVIGNSIGIHPRALLEFESLPPELKKTIAERIRGYRDPVSFYVEKLSEAIALLGAAFHPQRVIVRLSDFKSNEYAHLIGGERYEPPEENPMIGFRGAARYVSEAFAECFALECRAIRRVREDMGLGNVEVMVPFVRTLEEARRVIEALRAQGLERGKDGLRIIMMCEIPSNVILAEEFLKHFDGFSIGSNDLTQLTLALDRDSALVASSFDERNEAVKALLHRAIEVCKREGKYVGICGQGPSDYPDFAKWLLDEGIDSISLNPDTVVETWMFLAGQTGRAGGPAGP
jgi:pyruvate,water dikinase